MDLAVAAIQVLWNHAADSAVGQKCDDAFMVENDRHTAGRRGYGDAISERKSGWEINFESTTAMQLDNK